MLYRDYIADEGEKRTRTVHVGIDTRGTFQFDRVNPIFDLPSIFSLPLSLFFFQPINRGCNPFPSTEFFLALHFYRFSKSDIDYWRGRGEGGG